MGFGQSSQEKSNDKQVQGITQSQQDLASTSSGRSDKAFKWFKETAKPAKDFWTSILEGDRSKIMETLGPEISTIKDTYAGERNSNTSLTPRSGMRASGYSDSADKEAGQIGDTVLKARPTAAQQLMSLAELFGSTSMGETSQALGAYNNASSNLFGLNNEAMQNRQTQAQFWGGLGQSAGGIAGQFLLPRLSGGGSGGGGIP